MLFSCFFYTNLFEGVTHKIFIYSRNYNWNAHTHILIILNIHCLNSERKEIATDAKLINLFLLLLSSSLIFIIFYKYWHQYLYKVALFFRALNYFSFFFNYWLFLLSFTDVSTQMRVLKNLHVLYYLKWKTT